MTSFIGTLPPNETDLYKIVSVVRRLATMNSSGTWTPVFSFQTPGDLAFTYANQAGTYAKIDKLVFLTFQLNLTSFTHTTASGNGIITGAPFPAQTGIISYGLMGQWIGFTFAGGQTDVSCQLQSNPAVINFVGNGSGVAAQGANTTIMASGTDKTIRGSIFYTTP